MANAATDEALLTERNLAIDDCVSRADAAGLLQYLAEDYLYTHSNGRTQSKTEYADGIGGRENAPLRVLTENVIETHGDVAITRGNMDIVYHDERPKKYMRYVRIWRKQNENWQAISHRTLFATDRNPENN